MITFSIALVALIVGYLVYGRVVDRVFGPDAQRIPPSIARQDGVDYMPMPTWKVYLIQFLNIAGTGPIFGAIMGILFGPAAYLWIVFGCIFAGAVHDYMCGMVSLRKGGASLPEFVGDELGPVVRMVMRIFSVILLILVGAVFVSTPADLLANMTVGMLPQQWFPDGMASEFLQHIAGGILPAHLVPQDLTAVALLSGVWCLLIFAYYILATVLPINALIGRIYPLFGIALLIMALGVGIGIYTHPGWMPELTDPLTGNHPRGLALFPMLCITIACGAISGFHATQSPMMARCLNNERMGRRVFYGAMITEGIVALIWAAGAIKFAGSYAHLAEMGTPGIVVNEICRGWLGTVGAILAVLGVVAAPITSGDTAFRSARLILADFLHLKQNGLLLRLFISLPLFVVAGALMFIDFNMLWRYFAWSNQTVAMIALWAFSVWLSRQGKCYWITLVPAMFMTVVCLSYILVSPEGFLLPMGVGLGVGLGVMVLCTVLFFVFRPRDKATVKCEE